MNLMPRHSVGDDLDRVVRGDCVSRASISPHGKQLLYTFVHILNKINKICYCLGTIRTHIISGQSPRLLARVQAIDNSRIINLIATLIGHNQYAQSV